ncbi:hypothetical protein D3C73_849800 [compost metagenome]
MFENCLWNKKEKDTFVSGVQHYAHVGIVNWIDTGDATGCSSCIGDAGWGGRQCITIVA